MRYLVTIFASVALLSALYIIFTDDTQKALRSTSDQPDDVVKVTTATPVEPEITLPVEPEPQLDEVPAEPEPAALAQAPAQHDSHTKSSPPLPDIELVHRLVRDFNRQSTESQWGVMAQQEVERILISFQYVDTYDIKQAECRETICEIIAEKSDALLQQDHYIREADWNYILQEGFHKKMAPLAVPVIAAFGPSQTTVGTSEFRIYMVKPDANVYLTRMASPD